MGPNTQSSKKIEEIRVIEEAYAVTLDPVRLEEFEAFWETYLDAGLQDGLSSDPPASLAQISVHISRAIEILEQFRHKSIAEGNAQAIVDSNYGFGFIVNQTGKIIAANTDAEFMTMQARTLNELSIDEHSLSEMLGWISNRDQKTRKPVLFLNAHFGKEDKKMCLFLTPVDLKAIETATSDQYFLITSVEFDIREEAKKPIQSAFMLSNSEVEIALHLANGQTPKEIAESREVSILTVRTQIKHIIYKTESSNISDVIRKVMNMAIRFSSVMSQTERSVRSFSQESFVKYGSLSLRDGRHMEYIEQGHPQGRPVLHIHHFMGSPKQSAKSAQLAVLRGWRIISPSRAGYGNSDRHREMGIRASVAANAEDMAELVTHLGLKNLIVIGNLHAQKFAFKYRELVSHFVCVNKVPTWHLNDLPQMQRRQRNMIKTSIYAPQLVSFPVRLAKILIDTGREKVFFKGLHAGNSADLAVLDNPSHLEMATYGIKHSTQQGVSAFTLDVQGHHTDWTEDAKALQVPISIVVGSESTAQPPRGLDRFIKAVPSVKLYEVEGAGFYLPITHFPELLDILDSL